MDSNNNVISIEEKPTQPRSPYAQTGIYIYDKQVVGAAKSQKPSARGELEITDLNNWYLQRGQLKAAVLDGEWIDAGTMESYYKANAWAYERSKAQATANANSKKHQIQLHAQHHAQMMMELYQLDSGAFVELSISTPQAEEILLISQNPQVQQLILLIIEQRKIIESIRNSDK